MVQAAGLCVIVGFASVTLAYSYGSTKHLKDIVLGRCWDFQRQKVQEEARTNCSKIWDTFYTAFAYKDPCNTTFEDYKPYFDEIGMDIVKPNKVSAWTNDIIVDPQSLITWPRDWKDTLWEQVQV